MASESVTKSVNGNDGLHQPYGLPEQSLPSQTSVNAAGIVDSAGVVEDNGNKSNTSNNPTTGANDANVSVPKDEVGWYFVEQYYTTMSKTPEKLHLFYSKRSQFVSGVEAEKVSVSVGQRAINERIKELDIQDCKVRVSNVDSQESFKNIVVQVIGEMSNKAAPHRKFVQTFVLAEQPNGYFVLNDIFRYINEDEEEEPGNEETAENADLVHSPVEVDPTAVADPAESFEQQDLAEQVDRKLEEDLPSDTRVAESNEAAPALSNGRVTEEPPEVVQEDAPAIAAVGLENGEKASDGTLENGSTVEDLQPEKPKDPDPTPVGSPPAPSNAMPVQAPAAPAKATAIQAPPPSSSAKPAAPKTWANLVAANRGEAPANPSPNQSTPITPAPSQPKAASSSTNQPITPPPAVDNTQGRTPQNGNAGWQTAGHENGKRQGRQQSVTGAVEKDNVLGYIKNVTERVDASLLKESLLKHGKLVYFDVSRQKNCAFVEFADSTGYNNAVAANPHSIDGELIYVEERRPRPNAYGGGFGGRVAMRGGRSGGEGRPGSQGRGNYPKDGGRGGFTPRGRGNLIPRGRGQPQAA